MDINRNQEDRGQGGWKLLKILVTDGAGFIGGHLVDFLLNDHKVTIYDNLSTGSQCRKCINQERGSIYQRGYFRP